MEHNYLVTMIVEYNFLTIIDSLTIFKSEKSQKQFRWLIQI